MYVRNLSDRDARNVRVSGTLPIAATFYLIYVDHERDATVRCETPPTNETGDVQVRLGRIRAGARAEVAVVVEFQGAPGSDATLTLSVDSDDIDPNPTNNSYTRERTVPAPVAPPTIDRARSVRDPEEGYTVVVEGSGFDTFGAVGIGCDCTAWDRAVFRSATQVVLYGGSELRRQFPKGEPVRICVMSNTGGRAVVLFTRR